MITNQMKKVGITIMVIGLGVTILAAVFYFTKQNDILMSKFIIHFGNSFHFNWAPMIGITIMAFGEFILWESQHNKNLNEVLIKYLNKSRRKFSDIQQEIIYLINKNRTNFKEFKVLIMNLKF